MAIYVAIPITRSTKWQFVSTKANLVFYRTLLWISKTSTWSYFRITEKKNIYIYK